MVGIGLKLSSNQKGVSLIEVLVGFILLGGMLLGLTTFISSSYNGVRFLRAESPIKSYHANLSQILGMESTCTETLSALNPVSAGDALTKITRSGVDIIASFPVGGINTSDLPVSLVSITVASVQIAAPSIVINLQATYRFSNFQGNVDLVKVIVLAGTSDAMGNISTCHSKNLTDPSFAFVKLFAIDTKFGDLKVQRDVTVANAASKILVDPPGGGVVVPAAGIFVPSDKNLKTNFQRLNTENLDLDSVQSYRFNYIGSTEQNIGLIAQEVKNVTPEAVEQTGGKLGIKYSSLVPILWEQHKRILDQNNALKLRLDHLSQKIEKRTVSN